MTSPLYLLNLAKERLVLFLVYIAVFFNLFFCIGLSVLASEVGVYSESPIPALSHESGLSVTSAVTSDPIHLLSGSVTETVFDLSLPTPLVQSWYHKRTYSSDMSTGVADKELIGLQGHSWLGGNQSQVLLKTENKIIFVQSASNKRTFIETNGTFTAPVDFDATLVKRGTGESEEYVLTRNDSKEIFIYYGFSSDVSSYLRGKLKERTIIWVSIPPRPIIPAVFQMLLRILL
ncbi:MAG: hypothetical protein LBE12_05555 [Planctomycetaceae bacterium]|jgi:hypothetical protein|nr:hypothetical protein [Planctomycetaceae bacterium]